MGENSWLPPFRIFKEYMTKQLQCLVCLIRKKKIPLNNYLLYTRNSTLQLYKLYPYIRRRVTTGCNEGQMKIGENFDMK